MIAPAVHTEIMQRLARVEAEHEVRILLAIESGSRAWGFPSPNSDYDVRFIYAHPPSWYQAVDLEEQRDVIEYPITDDIDLNGWDVRKALRLFWKSNPAVVEWLQSPITYLARGGFRAEALALLDPIYLPERGIHHYRSMAKKTYQWHLTTPRVSLKKYFYALRPLLAARWVAHTGTAAPIEFERLLAYLPDDPALSAAIQHLLTVKRATPELGFADAVPLLNQFIEAELATDLPNLPSQPLASTRIALLNTLFRAVIHEE